MPFRPERCGKVDPWLAIISRDTCRFHLGVDQSFQLGADKSVELEIDQSFELSVDILVESEFSVDQLNCNFGADIHVINSI